MIYSIRTYMTRIPLSFLLFLCCISMLKAQEYDNGIKHFRDGNYTEAARLLSISAEDGNYNAQYALAQMYEMGMGVEQNLTKAMHWYKRSAPPISFPACLSHLKSPYKTTIYTRLIRKSMQKWKSICSKIFLCQKTPANERWCSQNSLEISGCSRMKKTF